LDEISRFVDALDDFWKPLFTFLFFPGVRIAEAATLKYKRVDFLNGYVQIRKNLVLSVAEKKGLREHPEGYWDIAMKYSTHS